MGHIAMSPWQGLRRLVQQAQPYPDDAALAGRLRAIQMKLVARLGGVTLPAQFMCAASLAWANGAQSPRYCVTWCASLLLIYLISMWRVRQNLQLETASKLNLWAGTTLILTTACIWASFPLCMLMGADFNQDIPILLVMIALTSSGSIVFQSIPVAGAGWVLVLTTGTLAGLWMDGYRDALAITCGGVLYVSVLLRNIWKSSADQFKSLMLTNEAERLAKSLSQHAHIVQTTSNGVLLLDARGLITWINDGFAKSSGYRLEEVLGCSPLAWLNEADQASVAGTLQRELVKKRQLQTELAFRDKAGRLQWVHLDIKCMTSPDGHVESYVLIATDISAIKQATLALQIEQDRQRHIIDGTHCGTWEMDTDAGVCKLGGHWQDIIGVDTSKPLVVEGAFLLDRVHPEDRPGLEQLMAAYLDGQVSRYVYEHRLRHEDGSWRWVSSSGKASSFDEHGRIEQISGAAQDITERKLTELALIEATRLATQANDAKSRFLATMSHEIRTPMNGVIGTAEWLKVTRLTEDQHDGVQTIVDSGRALLTIIDDILDFTKIEAGRMKMEAAPVSLLSLAEGVADALAPVALAKHVDLHVFVDPRLPSHVLGDPVRLRQILFNLLGNGVKFGEGSAQCPGQVDMHLLLADDDMQSWQVVVSDDGIGMTPETLSRLFKPFTQAEAQTTRRFGGTGLGLAISHRLVELMGGGMVAHSLPGHGSTFTATLPLFPATVNTGRKEATDLSDITCLLLPARNFRCDSFAAYLTHAGATVHLCHDVAEAESRARDQGPLVLIRDTPEGEAAEAPWLRWAQDHGLSQVRHLLVGRNLRGPLRRVSGHAGQLGRAHVQDVLRAVAVLADRLSPEVMRDGAGEFLGDAGTMPNSLSPPVASGHVVLVAEDDPTNQKVIRRQLHMLGHACEVASDGQEALRLWRSGQHDLLLSDLHMPLLDGYDLAKKIRQEEAQRGLPRMPILALTANAVKGEERQALACGMDAYLTKPIALDELGRSLLHWLPHCGSRPAQTADALAPEVLDLSPAAAPAQAAQPASLDIDVLRALVGDDEDTISELLGVFEIASTELGASLRQASENQAFDQIRQAAHQLKSAARSVGAVRLGELCQAAEQGARSQDVPAAAISGLLLELEQVHRQLATFKRESTT